MPRDAVGNGNPTTFAGTALTWDHENRLTGHGTALQAAYRGDGLRAWKEGSARTYFLYDGINIVCELDADGDLLASSTFGAAGLLSRGSVQYQFDPLGDAVHLLDGDGAVLANRLFDAWGNELTTGTFNPRGYRARYGYYTDEETGLIALAYRYCGPGVGRFLSRDPIGYEGGVSLWSYCASSPVARTDPAGTEPVDISCYDGPHDQLRSVIQDQIDQCRQRWDRTVFYAQAPVVALCGYVGSFGGPWGAAGGAVLGWLLTDKVYVSMRDDACNDEVYATVSENMGPGQLSESLRCGWLRKPAPMPPMGPPPRYLPGQKPPWIWIR